jgi:hypothetical protein
MAPDQEAWNRQNKSEKQSNNRCQVDCGKTIRVQIKSCNPSKAHDAVFQIRTTGDEQSVRGRQRLAAATHRPDMITKRRPAQGSPAPNAGTHRGNRRPIAVAIARVAMTRQASPDR